MGDHALEQRLVDAAANEVFVRPVGHGLGVGPAGLGYEAAERLWEWGWGGDHVPNDGAPH